MPSKNLSELTVTVIGCEGTGLLHLNGWANLEGVRVVAICDPNGITAARAAMPFEAAAFTEFTDALDALMVDIVDVCAPLESRYEIVQAALKNGANVLCDMPLTSTPDEADALVRIAAERERLLMPATPYRFAPALAFVKDLVENDDLGRLTQFRCRLQTMPTTPPTEGHGVLWHTGVHGVDIFRYLCGECVRVEGRLARVHPEAINEDSAVLLMEGERGTLGTVEAAWSPIGTHNAIELYGTAGACLIEADTGLVRLLTADQPVWQTRDLGGLDGMQYQIAHFADVVRGLQTPLVIDADALRALALCAQVYRQNGRD